MSDGVKLAADASSSRPGPGPFPVLLSRRLLRPRQHDPVRQGLTRTATWSTSLQWMRAAAYDSEGKSARPTSSRPTSRSVTSTTPLNWIASQPWCNGKIGMLGRQRKRRLAQRRSLPHQKSRTMVMVSRRASPPPTPTASGAFSNGARKRTLQLAALTQDLDVSPNFPAPTLPDVRPRKFKRHRRQRGKKQSDHHHQLSSGWYDISSEPVLDQFHGFVPQRARVFASIGPGHTRRQPAL